MTKQFKRLASAIITNLSINRAITVEGLRMEFDVEKTPTAGDNKAKLKIYNLSSDSRDLIQAPTTQGGSPQVLVELSCGYEDGGLKLLFRGKGTPVSTFKAPNWVTEINCDDGATTMRSALFEKKYPAGTRVADIAVDISKAAGLSSYIKGNVEGTIPRARSFSGPAIDIIEKLQGTYGFVFDIQDEEVIIQPEVQEVNRLYRTTLDRATGMINAPRVKGDIVEVEALINVDLRPNSFVNLNTLQPNLSGEYKIQKATFKGDTWGSQWSAVLEMTSTTLDPAFKSIRALEGAYLS